MKNLILIVCMFAFASDLFSQEIVYGLGTVPRETKGRCSSCITIYNSEQQQAIFYIRDKASWSEYHLDGFNKVYFI